MASPQNIQFTLGIGKMTAMVMRIANYNPALARRWSTALGGVKACVLALVAYYETCAHCKNRLIIIYKYR